MPATKNIDLPTLIERFSCEDRCRDYLEDLRWPDGIRCPRCDSDKISRIRKRQQFDCDSCRYQFSVRAGTIFHDSKLPLWKWFLATYMMVQSKKGVSANQLKRMLGVTYKTAWFLCHRIRAAMKDEDAEPLSGTIEIDETFVGGKQRSRRKGERRYARNQFDNKEIVMAAVQRGGGVRFGVVPNRGRRAVHKFVRSKTADKAERYYTDDWAAYDGIADENTPHETIVHSELEWVNGQVHTNTVEGVFSLLKRSIIGSYHKISVKHLPAYLDELEWRYNNRDNPYLFRDTILELVQAERLEYKALTA